MTGNQEIIDGLQKEIALLEKVVEAKNDLISQQEKVKNAELRKHNYEVETALEEEKGKNLKLTAQLNRDYDNSSIPSTQSRKVKKKIQNSRECSGRKPGGQPSHKGYKRKRQEPTNRVTLPPAEEILNDSDYKRLDKYSKNHLLFLHDPRIPHNNNEAERRLRNYQRKQKQAVSFRCFDSIDYFCQGMSVLVLMRQKEENVFDRTSEIIG